MKKSFLLGAIVSIFAILTGCETVYVDQPSSQIQLVTQAKIDPVLSIGHKIEGVASVERTLFIFVTGPGKFAEGVTYGNIKGDTAVSSSTFSDTVQMARAAAAYRACAENKADLIIYPRYVVRVDDYFFYKVVTAKVMGYKGVLKDVKVVDPYHNKQKTEMLEYLKDMKDSLESMRANNPKESTEMNRRLQEISSSLKAMNSRGAQEEMEKEKQKKDKNPTDLQLSPANVKPLRF